VTTDYRFTGQKEDASGLYYFNARYYDPSIGQFISPDTLVPDPSNVQAYNRYLYALGNPLRYNDPSGHSACMALAPVAPLVLGCQAGEFAMRYGPMVVQLASQWADKVPALDDWLFSTSNSAQNAAQLSNFGQFDPSNFNFDPNQFDPDKTKKITEIGQEAHRQFRDEFRSQMQQLGREEKAGNFLTERGVRDAFGKVARIEGQYGRPDAVDYKNHIIYELKPWNPEGIKAIANQYRDQIKLYTDLYEKAYGVKPQIVIIPYGE
jgi:RHS repeat-associated protein